MDLGVPNEQIDLIVIVVGIVAIAVVAFLLHFIGKQIILRTVVAMIRRSKTDWDDAFGKSPIYFFSGLGAVTAVLLLVFKDAIIGFVAGIQISVNNMVQVGDWIEMPNHNADGDVIDVTLTTVKVQNWDKTISTIPTHALISDSFKNWRGMSDAGGRRIKRSINIDMNSVQFADEELLDEIYSTTSCRLFRFSNSRFFRNRPARISKC